MGMYTEMIFGASLKRNTPDSVIESLKYMMGESEAPPSDFPFMGLDRCHGLLFNGASCYFGVHSAVSRLWYDDVIDSWALSVRSNIKNYNGEIEAFLNWIKPYIESGSGCKGMYAVVMYEEWDEPKIYYLDNEEL